MSDIETVTLPTHCDYDEYHCEVEKVRDCVEGSHKVKREGYKYLPHPSQVNTESPQARQRYVEYRAGAEYDEQPGDTLQTMLGKMRIHEAENELPDGVDYLVDDSDGDGMGINAAMEYTASNVLQVKNHIVVADFMGLSGVDLDAVSLADADQLNPRAVLKHYTRENVVNWHFSRSNGRMQLSWIALLERGQSFDEMKKCHTDLQSYLILGLDENGDYYQMKIVRGDGNSDEGERSYPTVNGQRLKFIPLEIVTDQERPSGQMPKGMGFLSKICDASLYKYRATADYKEFLRTLTPTIITKGWQAGDLDLFKEINGGREYLATGGGQVNNLPGEVDYDVLSVDTAVTPFENYLEYADKKILSMGGTAKQEVANMTATEADINASEQNAKLTAIADNIESCFERLVAYCWMFEGGIAPDTVMMGSDEVNIDLPRDFATPKLSVDEVRVIYEAVQLGIKTRDQAVKQLAQGGWDYQDAETTLAELEDAPPMVRTTPQPQNDMQ